jgi:3-oxoacyl-[acyl-carrier protein] reductase
MDLFLKGKIALITGASAGIGRETAKLLAEEGVQTVVVGRREAELASLSDEIVAAGGARPVILAEDLNDTASFDRIRDQVLGKLGHLDILINNLGQARPFTFDTPDEDWDEAFALNFRPPRKLAAAFIPVMKERKFGRIINLTATLEPSHVSGSLTSKAAVQVWAKGLSRVVAKDGITVNCVSPGLLMTEQIRQSHIPRHLPTKEDQERFLKNELPVGRFGDPKDAAQLIAFLSSPRASYITGQRIYVDGGWNRHI